MLIEFDKVYLHIGEFGWQQRIYFFSLAAFNLYPPFHMIQAVFTGEPPIFECTSQNGTTYNNSCPDNEFAQCTKVRYKSVPDTFAREWNLICDETYKAKAVTSVFMFGVLAGALIFGPISDSFGRRRTLFWTFLGLLATGIAQSYMPTYYLYSVSRFLAGVFNAGVMISMFVLSSELVGPSKRGLCGSIIQAFFALGIVLFSLIGFFISSWRLLTLVSSAAGGLLLLTFIWLPESPRWLVMNDRSEEALDILTLIAAKNGTDFPLHFDWSISDSEAGGKIISRRYDNRHHVNSLRLRDVLCRKPRICLIVAVQFISWFVNSVVYYGITLAVDEMGPNVYANTALMGLVELPAYIVSAILIDWVWFGRRKTLVGFMLLGGISCSLIPVLPKNVLALIGKLAISASFSIIYIQSTELFPTVLRNSGLGLCSCFARIGGIVAPFISLADEYYPSAQFIIMGVLCCIAGLLNLCLPETLGKGMPETLNDLDSLLQGRLDLRIEDLNGDEEDGQEDALLVQGA